MELRQTEKELFSQQLSWNSSNNSSYQNHNMFQVSSQETYGNKTNKTNKTTDTLSDKQHTRVIDDLLAQSNPLSNYLSQTSIAERISLQDKERDEGTSFNNHIKPMTKFNLSTLFDSVLAHRIVDYNKLLSKIDNIELLLMALKEELNIFRTTMFNQINNMHEETLEEHIEEIFTRLLEEKYHDFIKEGISKQSAFILSHINESFRTLVNQIPQDKYIQINSLNQLFSNKMDDITKEISEHRLLEQRFQPNKNINIHENATNMEDVTIITSNSNPFQSRTMDDYNCSHLMPNPIIKQEKETEYIVAMTNVKSEQDSALHVAQLNKMSLENIILQQ